MKKSILQAEEDLQPEEPTEEPEEETTEEPEEEPAENPEEEPAEEEPAEEPADEPEEEPEEQPAENPEEEPAEEESAENPEGESAENPEEEPAENPEGEPMENPEEEPMENPEEESTEEPTDEQEEESTEEESVEEPEEESAEESEEEPAEESEEEPEEEPEEDPATPTDLEPVEIRLDAVDSDVEAYILFMSDAGIPEDVQLDIRELTPAEQEAYQAYTARALNAEDESYLRYTKYLEFTLLSNSGAIRLNAPVRVTVILPDVYEGADALQVVCFADMIPVLLDSERTDHIISFETDIFDVFGIGNALVPVTNHETELAKVEVLSFSEDAPVSLSEAEAPEVVEGLEVLGTFTIEDNMAEVSDTGDQEGLYIKAELKDGAELDPMEGVALYSVDENGNTDILMEELTEEAKITELEVTQVAVIKDTGYRHLTLTVNPDETTDDQIVTLDGMMPKGSEAAVEDVTEQYADCFAAEEETVDRTCETETAGEITAEAEPDGTRTTLAAYDISISHSEGEYQPDEDKPISVEIMDSRIAADRNIELWHIRDDGTREQITEFTVEEGRIIFEAAGFSVYVVIDHEDATVVNPRVEFHFISKTDADALSTGMTAYYVTPRYTFRNMNNQNQCTQILKNTESLELITDPGNVSIGGMPDQFFYGWYVVDPVEISGSSDKYGVGISDTNLYYSWPVHPEAVSFGKPITITETNVQIGDTIHWSMEGVSGSGEVDSDGTLHVLLAPVYKKYNFVNFMLYARDENEEGQQSTPAAKNLMTRKLIAMGSASSVEVKISDVRSNSKDSTHLIFTGWEYKDEHGNWIQKQTVDYLGAEKTDPGRDGVYLTNLSIDDEASIDLYPIFIEARWVDFVSGISGVGATFVGSRFLEAWGRALDEDDQTIPRMDGENVFESLPTPQRPGYDFAGWYAFATTDTETGDITNLPEDNNPQPMTINYVDTTNQDNYVTYPVHLDEMSAVQITNGSGEIVYNGTFTLDTGNGSVKLFGNENGKLKFYEAMDRLKLYARWTPADTKITVIYWTENAEDDNYTASAARTVTTTQLSAGLNKTITSGSEITLQDLVNCPDAEFTDSIASNMILDDVGAVPKKENPNDLVAREEIFFELNPGLSDASKVIDGQGETIYNIYFSRIVFTLVFHVGRDGYAKNRGQQSAANDNWIEYMYNDDEMPIPGRSSAGPSYKGVTQDEFKMVNTRTGRVYTSAYKTDINNIKKYYVPKENPVSTDNDYNLYTIKAKYGAYIGDQWPSHANTWWQFPVGYSSNNPNGDGTDKTLYIWTAYYDSLYYAIAKSRPSRTPDGTNNANGRNADINGIYRYMSGELCANQTGNAVINENHVHHLVAYFGRAWYTERFKQYHTLFEAVPGGWLPEGVETVPGTDFVSDDQYQFTTWNLINNPGGDKSDIIGHRFYEMDYDLPEENLKKSPVQVISNVDPDYQLATEITGYEMVYSCYEKSTRPNPETPGQNDRHIYFFYRPKEYTLTLNFEEGPKTQQFFYKETLADALDYEGYAEPSKEGHVFLGWYPNEAGEGDPFDFEHERMPADGVVLYPVFRQLDYIVRIDPNGGEIDHWRDNSTSSGASTGFRANYNETISAYNYLERNYLRIDDAEAAGLGADHTYYYMNVQYISWEHDGRFVPADMRDALYLTEAEINQYWNHYNSYSAEAFAKRGATKFTSKDAWMDAYFGGHNLASLPKYRAMNTNEHYSFMGWYRVYESGSVASTPFDFNTKVKEDITIRALWRLDGGYYLKYNTVFVPENEPDKVVTGKISQWYDPEDPTKQLYADQSNTHILRGPIDVTPGWVFRGWRIVRNDGTESEPVWVPLERDENNEVIYYQPGERLVVDARYATEIPEGSSGAIIHMQAYYELEADTSRRPKVTELILDANEDYGGGYIKENAGTLPALDHPGTSFIDTTDNLDSQGRPTQLLFGDLENDMAIQSNTELHLYRYASVKKDGIQFFWNDTDLYTLLGFDPVADPENPSTHHKYVPAYSPDSVIAVTRKTDPQDPPIILYAMWEPKIYVTFRNETALPITVQLSGNGTDTIRIVNTVAGEYDRTEAGRDLAIPAGSEIKIVLPKADPGVDTITATVLNDHIWKKMTVSGEFPEGTEYGEGEAEVPYGYTSTYTAVLQQDQEGIIVTYTEEDDRQIDYDVNGGVWTETSDIYEEVEKDHLYLLDIKNIVNNKYEPADPICANRAFLGWTTNPDVAAQHDFSGTGAVTWGETWIIPENGESLLDVVRRDYLWDFSSEPPFDQTLYAVWADTWTVTFDLTYGTDPDTGETLLHSWTGPEPRTDFPTANQFYRSSPDSPYVIYLVPKIDTNTAAKPNDPDAAAALPGSYFYQWLKTDAYIDKQLVANSSASTDDFKTIAQNNYVYDFSSSVESNITLYTSWSGMEPQYFIFTVRNDVQYGDANDLFTFDIDVLDEYVDKSTWRLSDTAWDAGNDITTTLKKGKTYTVKVKVQTIYPSSGWGTQYGVTADVIDSEGNIVYSNALLRHSTLTYKYYTGRYQYTLKLSQRSKDGYTTTVSVEANPNNVVCGPTNTDEEHSFTFTARDASEKKTLPSGLSKQNVYRSGETNPVTVVFTNIGTPIVAPTAFTSRHTPFILMMAFGIFILVFGGIGIAGKRKRLPDSRPAKAKVQAHKQWVEYRTPVVRGAPPAPRCPQAELWRGTSGKRGDAR